MSRVRRRAGGRQGKHHATRSLVGCATQSVTACIAVQPTEAPLPCCEGVRGGFSAILLHRVGACGVSAATARFRESAELRDASLQGRATLCQCHSGPAPVVLPHKVLWSPLNAASVACDACATPAVPQRESGNFRSLCFLRAAASGPACLRSRWPRGPPLRAALISWLRACRASTSYSR